MQILREAGHLDTRSLCCVVDLGKMPDGLDAVELEQYLREHGTRPRCGVSPTERLTAIMRLNAQLGNLNRAAQLPIGAF